MMKKQFLFLVCLGAFQLFASRVGGESDSFLVPNSYTKTSKRSGGTLVQYNGEFYDLQTQEFLEVDEAGYFRTTYEYIMDGETQLFLSRGVTDLICVEAKPATSEELLNCVWSIKETTSCNVNHHIPSGGRTVTQWELKQGFNIFHYSYTLTIEKIFGLENRQEKELSSALLDKIIQRTGQLTGKKGKDTWYNDPSGQGSNGLLPQNASEEEAEFRKLFPAYAYLF
jgi:hypothetical protein